MFNNNKIHNCVIIGSGPAGYSASIYAARADLNPIMFMGSMPGGQLINTHYIDNYLGYPKGINGSKFMECCKEQAKKFNVILIYKNVLKVELSDQKGGIHYIYYENKKYIQSRGLIIATGSSPKFLDIDINKEKKLLGLGISFCATCDGFFHKGKDVAIVGGGDTALEEAIFLSKICNHVYILVRKNYFKASKILQQIIYQKNNIKILFCSKIVKFLGKNFLEGIKVLDSKADKIYTILISGLFIAIGHVPNTQLFKNQIIMDNLGYISVQDGNTYTNKPGVFAAGDVQDPIYRQAIISAGTGCMAALDLEKYLNNNISFYEK
ncbi:NAD(P)/FAD-dependent oxidoreductase [Blattabacterium cuenoti]|uniref:NAD(P)/FAD-dependent oxidoreductase n=1 Tax=Blattabacterium cuenoti TaxID=1653831 RepID=UPI00163B9376|nr:FAD-dependent oxidoreductase [Blattabacterium cuenoti]